MQTWRNLVLLGSFLGVLGPSIALAQTSQPTSTPTNKTAAPLFPFGNINPQPQGDPLFPFANPTPPPTTPPVVTDNKERGSLLPGIFYGGAATFGIAGVAGMVTAISVKSKAKQASNLGPGEPIEGQASEVKRLLSTTKTVAILSDISFGISISCAVGGYFLSKRAKAKPETTAPVNITPY
jgi:hypothetical protein